MANDFVSYTTKTGIAIYPHLTQPDTKFNANGEYKVSLSLTEQEAAPLKKLIEQEKVKAMAMIPEGKKAKESDDPYFNETDDEGQETGRTVFKFKMKAKVQNKQGQTIDYSHGCLMHKVLSLPLTLCGVVQRYVSLLTLFPITLPL